MAELRNIRLVTLSLLLAFLFCLVPEFCTAQSDDKVPVVGGESEVPLDDPEVVRLGKLVADKLSEGDKKDRTVVEILKATRQVVAGTLTNLKLKISDGEVERLYEASIVEQPWLNRTEILKLESLDKD